MEETIGECTNLHITYPALVVGYFAILRANRTILDAKEAPEPGEDSSGDSSVSEISLGSGDEEKIKVNDIAIYEDGSVSDGIIRFHLALAEMTNRRGVRNEISRYESMGLALIEPRGAEVGLPIAAFPSQRSPLHLSRFFTTIYQRYDERFVVGAPILSKRGITKRAEWSSNSPVFKRILLDGQLWPQLDFSPRLSQD